MLYSVLCGDIIQRLFVPKTITYYHMITFDFTVMYFTHCWYCTWGHLSPAMHLLYVVLKQFNNNLNRLSVYKIKSTNNEIDSKKSRNNKYGQSNKDQ